MDRRQIALKLVLKELGMDASIHSFNERLVLQKTIYLLQQMEIPLGYHFSWYIRGPYSRDLTADAFASLDSEVPGGWFLDDDQKSKIARAKTFSDSTGSDSNQPRELEKLASLLFVIKTRQAEPGDVEGITNQMKKAGKDFSQEEVKTAIGVLSEHNLI